MPRPCYICVDIEAAGPTPSDYALLSIGAATVDEPRRSFYVELKPTSMAATEEASAIHGLALDELAERGLEPKDALVRFEAWLSEMVDADQTPIFVAFNAPFDWMFINDYYHRFLGRNPFGHRALDMKALYMGMRGVPWAATTHQTVSRDFGLNNTLPHHAEEDAIQQAELFRRMLDELEQKHPELLKEA